MAKYTLQVWSKTGGLVTKVTIDAPSHQQAKELAQQQNPNMIIRS